MTTAQPNPPDKLRPLLSVDTDAPALEAVRIGQDLLLDAAGALVAEVEPDRRLGGRRFLDAAREHGLDLSNLWGVLDAHGSVRHAALATPGSGRTHMCFTSHVRTSEEAHGLAVALDAACGAIATRGLAQALLDSDDITQAIAFERAGFRRLATLGYLRRRAPRSRRTAPPTSKRSRDFLPEGVTLEQWRPGLDQDFIAALERSYADTLDCPELCGLRDTSDVLESHKAAGEFHPSLWWLVRDRGEPSGAMLFSPSPQHTHIELVYLGIAPSLRGRGLAKDLLDEGLRALERRPERVVTCAVDQRNEPAKRLYRAAGFEQFSERVAYIRPVGRAVGG